MSPARVLALLLAFAPGARAQAPPEGFAEILPIMEKLQHGEPLTPEEQAALQRFGQEMGVQGGPPGAQGPAAQGPPAEWYDGPVTLENLGVCPARQPSLPGTRLGRSEYVALLRRVGAAAAAKDPEGHAAVDALLAGQSDPLVGEHVGAAVLTQGAPTLALYATAQAGLAAPDDPLVANNLGVLLSGLEEYGDADAVLRYADGLEPSNPLVVVDRAWTAYDAGDAERARSLFQEAMRLEPDLSGAHLGLGLLAACAGNADQAKGEIRKSLETKRSKVATMALSAIDPVDPGPWKSDLPLNLPTPPIGRSIQASAALVDKASLMKRTYDQVHIHWASSLMDRLAAGRAAYEADGDALEDRATYARAHDPYAKTADEALDAMTARMTPLLERWTREGPMGTAGQEMSERMGCRGNATCEERVDYRWCLSNKRLAETLNEQASTSLLASWKVSEPALQDLWAYSVGCLEHFHSERWRALYASELEHEIAMHLSAYTTMAAAWDGTAKTVLEMECTPPSPPQDVATAPKTPSADGKGICDRLKMKVKLPHTPFTIEIDCAKTVVTVDTKLQEFELTTDVLNNEVTVYWGVKGGMTLAEGQIGDYVTFVGNDVTDAGMRAEGTLGWGPWKGKGDLVAGFTAIEGGPNFKPVFDTHWTPPGPK